MRFGALLEKFDEVVILLAKRHPHSQTSDHRT